jgi:nicotinamidase-related amidase
MTQSELTLRMRRQELSHNDRGFAAWQAVDVDKIVAPEKVAIVICDMWDNHWSRGAAARVTAMAPRMNRAIHAARERGISIVHAPSETMEFYLDDPARKRMRHLPDVELPELGEHPDYPLPIDDSDGGSDTGEASWYKAWTRQHPAIEIDQEKDGISDDGAELYRFLQDRAIEQVLIMGVHTNMCILRRSFAIKALVRRGIPVALVRDLTDSLYNPERSPYVSHDEGTQLIIGYIEKFWCPSIHSDDLTIVG